MSKYLKLRGTTWYTNIPVPKELRDVVGQFAIVKSLGTGSLGEAHKLLKPHYAEAIALFESHRGDPHGAQLLRQLLAKATTDEELENLDAGIGAVLDRLPEKEALKFANEVYGVMTMATATKEYLTHVTLAASTVEKYTQAANEFPAVRLDNITAQTGRDYLAKLQAQGLGLRTRRQRLTILGVLWRGFRAIGLTDLPSPFDGLKVLGKVDGEKVMRAFTDDEATALMGKLKSADLREYFALALITGARLDELAHLWRGSIAKRKDCTLMMFRNAKTKSSNRDVPVVHPVGRAILAKWAKERPEEVPKGRASKLISNRFTNAKQGAGLPEVVDFHSTRRYWATRAERLKLDPIGCARYVGHAVKGMTFGLYADPHHEVLLRVGKGYTLPRTVENAFATALRLSA
jgi:integrase